MKKTLSLLLSLVMVMTTLCALPFTTKAAAGIAKVEMEYELKPNNKKYFNISGGNYTVTDYKWMYRDGTGTLKNTASTDNAHINYNYVLYAELTASSGYKFNNDVKLTLNGGAVNDNGTLNSTREDAYNELDYRGNQCFTTSNDNSIIWFSVRYYPVGVSFYGNAPSSKRPDFTYPDFVSPGQEFFFERGQLYGDTHIREYSAAHTKLSDGKQEIIGFKKQTEKGIYVVAPSDAVKVSAMVYVDNCEYVETVKEAATCTKKGKAANICPVCKAEEFNSEKELPIDPNNHANTEAIPAVPATFKKAGKTEGTKCKDCGKIVVEQKAVAKLVSPKIKKLTKAKKGFTAKWNKAPTVDGYQIRYALKKNMKGAKKATVKKDTTLKKKVSKLKRRRTYYVQVRAYKTVNGKKTYSAWSAKKKIKTK